LDTARSFVKISILNLSPGAEGYRLYRKNSPFDSSNLLTTFTGIDPKTASITFTDSTVRKENRYYYDATVYNTKGQIHAIFVRDIYIYVPIPIDSVHFTLLGRIPLNKFTGWSRIVHDTVFFKDYIDKSVKISMIETSDPAHPTYLGTASDFLLDQYNLINGMMDSTVSGAIISNEFPFLYWYKSDQPTQFYIGLFDNGRFKKNDSVESQSVAVTSKFVIYNYIKRTGIVGHPYTALSQKYNRFQHDSLPNPQDYWTIGDSNYILAYHTGSGVSHGQWNVYIISEDGKNLTFKYSCIFPYERKSAVFMLEDVSNRIFFFFPYLFQISTQPSPDNSQILEVIDIRQSDTCSVLGRLGLENDKKEQAISVLFDTKRNLLLVFYPSELDLYSIDKDIEPHMGVPPSEIGVRKNSNQPAPKNEIRSFVSDSKIHIQLPIAASPFSISLYTIQGRLVTKLKNMHASRINLTIERQPGGIYLLSIESPILRCSKKIICP